MTLTHKWEVTRLGSHENVIKVRCQKANNGDGAGLPDSVRGPRLPEPPCAVWLGKDWWKKAPVKGLALHVCFRENIAEDTAEAQTKLPHSLR